MNLSESHYKHIKDADINLAILPWGATEAHNYHLPYGTDTLESEKIAEESVKLANEKGAKAIALPVIPFGVNTGQKNIKLTMNINPSTQFSILHDIIDNLYHQGIHKLLILNSHGGNDFKQMIRELGTEFPGMLICTSNWFQSLNKNLYFEEEGDHADEMETSLLLHLAPELVLPLDEAGEGKSKKFKVSALNEKWAWAERQWTQVTADTGIGNPKKASKEKGEKYFTDITQKMAQLIYELSEVDSENMYE